MEKSSRAGLVVEVTTSQVRCQGMHPTLCKIHVADKALMQELKLVSYHDPHADLAVTCDNIEANRAI